MSGGALRSKQGCWTCRLRRKKCDERQPVCTTCEQLKITCYGYGTKPDWMDGGAKEKAMIDQIKQIVKHTSRRKGRLNVALSRFQRKEEAPKLAPKPTAPLPTTSESPPGTESTVVTVNGSSSGDTSEHANGSSPVTFLVLNSSVEASEGASVSSWSPFSINSQEAVLLMHFIDNVFPLQYPVYKPSVAEGGRGWVISLLLRTKPLYHACLGLASYHRGSVLLEQRRGPCNTAVVVEQERHLAICLKEFRETIQAVDHLIGNFNCPKNSLGLMACIVQLIYFELFAGHDTWKIHLQAASSTFSRGYYDQLDELDMIRGREAIWDPDGEAHGHGCEPNEQKAVFRFMGGVIIWLDLISSITAGTSPSLVEYHSHALSTSSHIKLENIMGCHNWVAVQIGRISALHELKMHKIQHGCPNITDYETQVVDIRAEIQRGLTEMCLGTLNLNQTVPTCFGNTFITRMFAFAAGLYLDLVVNGYVSSSEIFHMLRTEAMMVLRGQVPAEMMHTIIFPLYIIGSVAVPEDQAFFRYVFQTSPVLDPSLEHRSKILPLLEKVWQQTQLLGAQLTWEDSLKLADQSLLLI
ncbi:uncharacterized protein LY89DRAFT_668838 [Mollisia scopiformis]|uniref:Zn(2)-C6 fungal-type domain-containing protein n=1 Tax=Mollisia scopiformis TaxID=149040 RepID=A0A194XBI5_MOLSC|nr:uncharacterized protein LY89DRAFT_668838 [Mollisia scopiformis]KUJ17523.1 hypothetical protein LY89DRAFT_668838 [Mollisia scopiformis]